ncbi:recombinase family protein [Oscillospiraceae bacterium PP1C4]
MDLYEIRNQLNNGKSIYDLKLRATFYARVSTDKDEQLHSLQAQIKYYSDFIISNPNWTFVEGYIDEGISGTSVKKRESFLKMIDDARLKKFDFIVTKEISRFSRNTVDSIQYTQQLLSYGVGVLFQSDNINTLMPDSELRLTIMSSIAQDEVRKTSERVKFGFKRAIEKGIVLGNSKIWGYKKESGRLVIVEEEAELIRKIYDMYAIEGAGMRSICNWLSEQGIKNTRGNDFSFSTIKGILTNPKYKGYYCGGKTHKFDYKLSDVKYLDQSEWVMYKDETGEIVPAIVSEEIWDKTNLILAKRSKQQSAEDKTSYQNKYPYSGKIICMEHQVPYYRACYRYKSGSKEVWQCKKYSEQGKAGCESPTIYTSELDEIMRQVINMVVENKADLIHDLIKIYSEIGSQSKIREDIAKLKIIINDILKKKDKLLEFCMKGKLSDDEFEIRNERFNNEIADLKAEIADLQEQELKNRDIAASVETLRGLIANELNFENGFSNGIMDSLLNHIEVYKTDKKSEIRLKVYLKVIPEQLPFTVKRARGNTSVCYESYT